MKRWKIYRESLKNHKTKARHYCYYYSPMKRYFLLKKTLNNLDIDKFRKSVDKQFVYVLASILRLGKINSYCLKFQRLFGTWIKTKSQKYLSKRSNSFHQWPYTFPDSIKKKTEIVNFNYDSYSFSKVFSSKVLFSKWSINYIFWISCQLFQL